MCFIIGGNQEHHSGETPTGCPKRLAEAIRTGQYNPLMVGNVSAPELRDICQRVGIQVGQSATKVNNIYTFNQN